MRLQQEQEKADKIATWEIWIIRIRERQDQCQAKTKALKSAGEPQNKKDVEEHMILAKVSISHFFSREIIRGLLKSDYVAK